MERLDTRYVVTGREVRFESEILLTPYAEGNTGVPYMWSWQAEAPGPHAMVTALVNLLDNAWKYSDEDKQISLGAEERNGAVNF